MSFVSTLSCASIKIISIICLHRFRNTLFSSIGIGAILPKTKWCHLMRPTTFTVRSHTRLTNLLFLLFPIIARIFDLMFKKRQATEVARDPPNSISLSHSEMSQGKCACAASFSLTHCAGKQYRNTKHNENHLHSRNKAKVLIMLRPGMTWQKPRRRSSSEVL